MITHCPFQELWEDYLDGKTVDTTEILKAGIRLEEVVAELRRQFDGVREIHNLWDGS